MLRHFSRSSCQNHTDSRLETSPSCPQFRGIRCSQPAEREVRVEHKLGTAARESLPCEELARVKPPKLRVVASRLGASLEQTPYAHAHAGTCTCMHVHCAPSPNVHLHSHLSALIHSPIQVSTRTQIKAAPATASLPLAAQIKTQLQT